MQRCVEHEQRSLSLPLMVMTTTVLLVQSIHEAGIVPVSHGLCSVFYSLPDCQQNFHVWSLFCRSVTQNLH